MIKAIIFDCFGVLITDALESLLTPLRTQNQPLLKEIIVTLDKVMCGSITPDESYRYVATLLDMTYDDYMSQISAGEVRNDELLAHIKVLKQKCRIGMLSNVGKGIIQNYFDGVDLAEYFDAVVASGDIGFAKPEARAYEITAERLSVRLDECLFIDDRIEYCDGARHVGMNAVQFINNEQFKRDLKSIWNIST